MNRKSLLLFLVFTFLFSNLVIANNNDNIRVGLESKFKEKTYIQIQNSSLIVGYDLDENILNGVTINGNDFKMAPSNAYYIMMPEVYSNYSQAYNVLSSYPYNKSVGLIDTNLYTVVLGPFSTEEEAMNILNLVNKGTLIKDRDDLITLYDGAEAKMLFLNNTKYPQVKDSNNVSTNLSSERRYRGIIEFLPKDNNTLTPVNIVDREEYLYSVVPSEMPQSWEMEALKAQALAARTYSVTQQGKHEQDGYDVCDTVHSQVYTGMVNENPRTNQAVNETKGLIITYQNEPIDAVFYSSSGGSTQNSEDAWSATVPYLRAVADPYDTTGLEWERTFTYDELTVLAKNKGKDIGNVYDVTIDNANEFGRPVDMTIHGDKGKVELHGEGIRTFFSATDEGSLKSTNFIMEKDGDNKTEETTKTETTDIMILVNGKPIAYKISDVSILSEDGEIYQMEEDEKMYVIDSSGETKEYGKDVIIDEIVVTSGDSVTFKGRGWGHGVGMSQHGANGMAKQGKNFTQIIQYYYQGVDITSII